MRWGLIARSETDRGLGIQTYAMYENLQPDKTLLVLVPKSGFSSHPELYPDAAQVTLTSAHGIGILDEETVRDWWKDLDVVISVETLYDWRLVEWAKADGVRTIVHGNPEFWMATNPQPDVWWWPTAWRLQHLPTGPIVPVPVDDNAEFTAAHPDSPGNLRVLHIAGNGAMADRNGTNICLDAMRRVPTGVQLDIHAQVNVAKSYHMRIRTLKPVANRWEMFRGQHVLLIPRRYGGLCLPVNEAMASGLMVMMSDCSPNTQWPISPLASDPSRVVSMQTGPVETHDVLANVVANHLKHFAQNRSGVHAYQSRSREWTERNRWSVLKETYYDQINSARI